MAHLFAKKSWSYKCGGLWQEETLKIQFNVDLDLHLKLCPLQWASVVCRSKLHLAGFQLGHTPYGGSKMPCIFLHPLEVPFQALHLQGYFMSTPVRVLSSSSSSSSSSSTAVVVVVQ